MVEVPVAFVREILEREGDAGRAWLEALPGLVDRALVRWGLTLSGRAMHGAVGVVVPVRRADGSTAVLKVSFPHPGNLAEPRALAAWAGRGAVRLVEYDAQVFAMVLEKASGYSLRELPDAVERMVVAGRLNRRLAVLAPEGFPSLKDVAGDWAREIDSRYQRVRTPLADRLVGRALESCRELAADQPNLLVHGDLNFSNILRSSREPWLAIDPKGWAGDPAYDAVNLLREHWHTMAAPADLVKTLSYQLAAFAEAAEMERERVIRWVQACAVKDALWSAEFGEPTERATANETVAGITT
ncbi:aminoglycoside phosphotransferase family protein [Streptomyces sp. SID13031]|uniref:aminoglycoside phosphotransferase family protein n=1 Tax=Streptomyces sp. SID13031 TaxID=2706046 RepID=UPI0013C7606F|nr:aminoglycoside phosphotransferase family protein [Streptomyces sp. SID13031]NEA31975.1 phosphotransferase [Streptomyces sp. SID13031]